jgi:hypothetical protein
LGNALRLRVPVRGGRGLFLLLGRLVLRERCLDVFEGEPELVGWQPVEPFVPRAKAVIVGFVKKVMQLVAFGHELRLLGPFRIALRNRRPPPRVWQSQHRARGRLAGPACTGSQDRSAANRSSRSCAKQSTFAQERDALSWR